MNAKTTIVLLVLLIALGAYLALVELDRETTRQREDRLAEIDPTRGEPLFAEGALTLDNVRSVTVARGETAYTLSRTDDDDAGAGPGSTWWQTQPVRFPLRSFPVEDLVRAATDLAVYQRFVPGEGGNPALEELGFDDDATRVTLTPRDGEAVTLVLGRRGARDRAYAMLGDEADRVLAVGQALHRQAVDKGVADFRLKRTEAQGFDLPDQVDAVTLERGGETLELHRLDGRWFLDAEGRQRADADASDDLARAAGGLSIERFVEDAPESLALYGLAEPTLSVAVVAELPAPAADDANAGEGAAAEAITRTHTVRLGGPADLDEEARFATWVIDGEPTGVVFTVRESSAEDLRVDRDALRDEALVLSDAAALSEVRLEREGQADVRVERDGEGVWRFAEAMATDDAAGPDRVSDWIDDLAALSSSSFAEPPSDIEPAMTLTLLAGGDTELVRFYRVGKALHAVRNDETIAYVLDTDAAKPLSIGVLALVDPTLLDVAEDELTAIDLTQADGTTLRFERVDAATQAPAGGSETPPDADAGADAAEPTWRLAGYDSFETDALDTLVAALEPLRVERWLDGEVLLGGRDVVEMTLTLEDGEACAMRVDGVTGRGTAAFAEYDFVLPTTALDAMAAEFRDRLVLPLGGEAVIGLVVTRPDGSEASLAYDAAEESWSSEDGEVDAAAARAMADRLAGLRVERYVDAPDTVDDVTTILFTTEGGRLVTVRLVEPFLITRTLEVEGEGWFRVSEGAAEDLTAWPLDGDGGDE